MMGPYVHSAESVALVGVIAWEIEAFLPVLQEHIEDLDGQILPHVLMGNYAFHCQDLFVDNKRSVVELLTLLERVAEAPSQPIRDLLQVSFVDMLPFPGERADQIRGLLGKRLAVLGTPVR